MLIQILLLFLFAFPPLVSAQTIYKWKDEKGQWHFSNTPSPGPELQATPTTRSSTNIIQGTGRVAVVLSVLERQEGKLIEVRFL